MVVNYLCRFISSACNSIIVLSFPQLGILVKTGPKELTGALDLISHFKLLPHHEFFCKNSRPVSVLETHYLSNVVGDTEIRKGEGMQLSQLVQTTLSRDNSSRIKPFNLDVLGEAFHLRESASVNLSPVRKCSNTFVFALLS